MESDYTKTEADEYRCRTVVPYSDGAEVRDYQVSAEELSGLIAELNSPQISETVISVEPVDNERGKVGTGDVTVEIDVSSEMVAAEIGFGILGRARQVHENPDDEFEDVAIELKELGNEVVEKYEDPDGIGDDLPEN